MGARARSEGRFLQGLGGNVRVIEGHRRCGGGRDVIVDELRYCSGSDAVDESEGGEEENGGRTMLWWIGLVGGKGQVGGGEHEFL